MVAKQIGAMHLDVKEVQIYWCNGVSGQLVPPGEGRDGTLLILVVIIHELKRPAVRNYECECLAV